MKNDRYVIPCFIPMEGCRNCCIYCDQRNFRETRGDRDSIAEIIARYIGFTRDKSRDVELAFYGGTFLNLPVRRTHALLGEARKLKEKGDIRYVRISTTPDSINRQTMKLVEGTVDTVELGVQTLSPLVLQMIGRNGSEADVLKATEVLKSGCMHVGHQLMIGLPFETDGSFKETINKVAAMRPDFVRLYPLVVFRNTLLDVYSRTGVCTTGDRETVFRRGAYALWKFRQEGIHVIRVGLTNCIDTSAVSHGALVEDYRGKMEGMLWRTFLSGVMRSEFLKITPVFIECSDKDYNGVIGHGKENIEYFRQAGWQVDIRRGFADPGSVRLSGHSGVGGRIYRLCDMQLD